MAESTERFNILYRIMGAAKVAAETKKVGTATKNLERGLRNLKAGMMGLSSYATGFAGSIVAIGLAFRQSVMSLARYSQAQARLRTTLAATTESYRQNARISSAVAERAAINLGYSTTEANDAMTTMVQTGIEVHASMRLIGSSMRLARIGEMETSNATRFLVDTMNMFRGEMAEQDLTLREFADSMSGKLAVAANMASTNIEQLQQAFRYAGTELSALGYSSSEVMSSLAGLSVVGLRGTTAGTRLRGAVAALTDPSQRVQREMDRLAGSTGAWRRVIYDASGELLPLRQRMSNLMTILGRARTDQERSQLEFAIFGRRAFAAGVSMSRFNEAARRMLDIHDEINDTGNVTNRVMRMEEERMRGFGIQVQQLKHGLDDLGIAFGEILFGAMDDSREGFGTYVREIARGIRLIGMLEDGHDDMRGQFEELSPRVRENARQIREFLINLASLVKMFGWLAKKFMWFATNHPYITTGLIAMRVAFGGFIPILGAVLPRMGSLIATFRQFPPSAVLSGRQLAAFNMIAGVLAVDVIGRLTSGIQDLTIQYFEMGEEMNQIRSSTVASHSEWARGIPIIGHLAAQYVELAGTIQRAWQMYQEVKARREGAAQDRTMASAGDRIQARYDRMRSGASYQGWSEEELARSAISNERSASVQRLATLLHGRGRTGREGVRTTLESVGMSGDQLESMVTSVHRAMRNMGDLEASQARVIAGDRSLEDASLGAARQLAGFEGVADRFNDAVLRAAGVLDQLPQSGSRLEIGAASPEPVPVAQDAYVNRGGLMGVSSGDVIVSRQHLANAVLARQGAMAGPAVSMAGEGMMVGPTPTVPGGGGGGAMNISIPVMLDGREIARAVGRANVTQLERGGGRLPPGQRRSLRETGFNRVV